MDYVKNAVRTLSPEFHSELVHPDALYARFRGAVMAAEALDQVKKALFYGRIAGSLTRPTGGGNETIDYDLKYVHEDPVKARQILHGVIGLVTEAGELLEAVYTAMNTNTPLDLVNVTEETGDSKWYLAVICHALGTAWTDDEHVNIDKLRARFPDKFTEDNANTRDLDTERAILEGRAKITEKGDVQAVPLSEAEARPGMEPARKFFKGEDDGKPYRGVE